MNSSESTTAKSSQEPHPTIMILDCGSCAYKTKDLPEAAAIAQLNSHTEGTHNNTGGSSRTERKKRPTIKTEISMQEWTYFLRRWDTYKKSTGITGDTMKSELMECCDEKLDMDIHRIHPNIHNKNENLILEAIKDRAVITENPVVAQVTLMSMKQGPNEKIRAWVANLKGQANTCDYQTTVKCSCGLVNTADFTDQAVRQTLAANIQDPELQKDLLSELNTRTDPMPLEDMIKYIEGKENGKESAWKLKNRNTTYTATTDEVQDNNAIRSSYRRQAQQTLKPSNHKEKCSYCGLTGHGNHKGRGSTEIRQKLGCPAIGKSCNKCLKKHHFSNCCRSPAQKLAAIDDQPQEDIIIGGAIMNTQD